MQQGKTTNSPMDETTKEIRQLREKLAQLENRDTVYIDTSIALARLLSRTDPHEGIAIAQRAMALSRSLKYREGIARSHAAVGHAHISLSNYELARKAAEEAIPLFEELQDDHGLLDARNLLGISYNTSGMFDKALDIFLQNAEMARDLDDGIMLGKALNNAACMMQGQGNYSGALEYYLKTYHTAQECGNDQDKGVALINIAVTQIELGNHEEALGYLIKSLNKVRHVPEMHARVMHNFSRCHMGLNNLPKALEFAEQSLEMFEAIQNPHGIIEAVSNLGEVLALMDEHQKAEACFLRAITLARSKNENTNLVHNQMLLGRLHRQMGKVNLAISELEKVFSLRPNYKTVTYQAHLELSLAHESKGNYQQALEHHKQYMKIKNQVLTQQAEQRMESMRASFQLEQAERETELLRQKNAELAEANRKLKELTEIQKRLDAQKSQLVRQLESYAHTDALTGLFNRRYLNKRFALEFRQAREKSLPLCVLIGDLDGFKQVNDRYSHETGDTVLAEVSRIISSNIREKDILSRYGGEEFVLVMPETTMEDAAHISRRLNRLIEEHDWESIRPGLKVTISLGLSCNTDTSDHEAMLALADEKLYTAKAQGKNRLCY
ncbi:tetratricopeptide repeat-containing diguanylate cyclase [Thiolapillus sp.]